jgi:hypothetical protein
MPTIELDHIEFGQLMNVLANAEGKNITWAVVNPLLMKIGEQLRVQQQLSRSVTDPPDPTIKPNRRDGSGKETQHG